MGLSFSSGSALPSVGSAAYNAAASSNASGAGAYNASTGVLSSSNNSASYSPTVVSDANSSGLVGNTIGTANSNITAINGGNTGANTGGNNTNNGSNNGQNGNNGNTSGTGGIDTSNMSYADILNYENTNQTNTAFNDPLYQQQVNLIKNAGAGADAATQASIAAIQAQYQSQYADTVSQQQNSTANVEGALTLAGSSQYAPVSSANILSAKNRYDLATLTQLSTANATNVAKLQQAIADNDYKTASDLNTLITNTRDKAQTMAQNIVQGMQAQQSFNQAKMVDARNYTLDLAKFNEQTTKDQQTILQNKYEFRDLKDEMGNTIGTQVYDKATGSVVSQTSNSASNDPSTTTIPTATTLADGSVDKSSQYQTLSSVPAAYQSLVWGIVNGKVEPPNARTKYGMTILGWVTKVDPTLADGSGGFDATKYAARLTMQKSLASYTAGSYGSGVVSANKVIAHLGSFLNSSATLPSGAVNPFNINAAASDVLGGIGALFGATGIQSAQAESEQSARGLTDEMAKFFKGTGSTDVESLKSWGESLNPNASPGTQYGVVQGTLDLFSGQLNSFIQQYTTVMGHAPDLGTILQPQTMQKLSAFKNVGYNIDLPGVNYTDVNAYLSNGGSQGALSQARNALVSANDPNNPATAENILQLAQVMNQ